MAFHNSKYLGSFKKDLQPKQASKSIGGINPNEAVCCVYAIHRAV